MTLGYMSEVLGKGTGITLDDIGRPRASDASKQVEARFDNEWAVESSAAYF